jgi:two-component system OmpR family response regulator
LDPVIEMLLIEDEVRLVGVLLRGLGEEGFSLRVARTGEEGLRLAAEQEPQIVVLDVGLPGIDGFETCRRLRDAGHWAPILMLSAQAAVEDRVHGLESGADDYLAKPFSFAELLARVRALTRRHRRETSEPLAAGGLSLDPAERRAWRGKTELKLSAREFDLLEAFMRRAGQAVSRDWLLEQVWDLAYEQRSNVVDVYVRYLRAKIDEPFDTHSLETVRGVGYRLTTSHG